VNEGVSVSLCVDDFSGVSLFGRSGTAVQPRVLQGAYQMDGGLDLTFLGQSVVDDLRGDVLADNGRRNDNRLLLNISLGHCVRRVDSLNKSHRVYTRMSFYRESDGGNQPVTVSLLVLTSVSVSLFTSVTSQTLV
jgi:hypothetical protein